MTGTVQSLVRAAGEAALQATNEAVLVLDELGSLVDVNPAGARLLGRPAAEVLGRRVDDLLVGWAEAVAAAAEQGQAVVGLRPAAEAEGAALDRAYTLRLSPVRDTADVLIGEVALLHDLTERRRVEASLRDSQARFEEVLETISDAYYESDLNGTLTYVNGAFVRGMGYSRDEIIGRNFRRLTNRENARSVLEAFRQVYLTGASIQRADYLFHRQDGAQQYGEMSISLRRDPAGRILGFRGFVRDVNDRVLAEQSLRRSQARFEEVLETISDGYYESDLNGTLTYINGVFHRALNYTREEVIGRNFRRFTDRENARSVFQAFNEVYRTGLPLQRAEYLFRQHDGGSLYIELSISLRRDEAGRPAGFRGFVRDVTDRFAAQEALRESKEAAEAANRAKSTFLTTVSHELRTPLTSVLGFAKLIKKRVHEVLLPALDPADKRLQRASRQVSDNLDIIVSEGERLTALINNLLDLAKIEAGKVEWNMQPVAIGEVVTRAVSATQSLAEQKQLQLSAVVPADLPVLQADFDRLLQVVINLISNAVKFTDAGSVTLRAWSEAGDVLVSVTDSGVGLASDDLGRVFDQFVQVGNTLTDKPTGTGLGLPICKQIVEHHGGRIWAESEVGQGSRFIFRLPATPALPLAAGGPAASAPTLSNGAAPESVAMDSLLRSLREHMPSAVNGAAAPKRVLIVDDDRSIRALLRQELEADGYEVHAAENGREALSVVKQARPDLVILDVMMPELTGFDVAAVLRSDPATKRIPIIILSVIPDRERGYRVGVDRYFTKPVEATALLSAVGELLSQGASQKNVLVVDEDAAVVQTLSEVLQTQGYTVSAAYTGPQGIDLALTARPDLVIVNSLLSEQSHLVQTLRFEKGLENVAFLLFH